MEEADSEGLSAEELRERAKREAEAAQLERERELASLQVVRTEFHHLFPIPLRTLTVSFPIHPLNEGSIGGIGSKIHQVTKRKGPGRDCLTTVRRGATDLGA